MSFNIDIRNKVAEALRLRGFEVVTTDANANDDKNITDQDFNLFLSIHYDADIYGTGGGFVDYPDPSVDKVTQESQRIVKVIEEQYFSVTKISDKPLRRNANTKFYYMWKFLTEKTPCALIECGVGMHVPDDHTMLHFNRDIVVQGIVQGICKAFEVTYEKPVDQCIEVKQKLAQMQEAYTLLTKDGEVKQKKLNDIKDSLTTLQTMLLDTLDILK